MAKIALTAALLVALVAFATATTYTTTVTTTSYDRGQQGHQQMQQCQSQLQGRQFRSCKNYFQQGSQGQFDMGPLEMTVENPYQGQGQQGSQQQLRSCCEQIRNVNPQCRCEAISHALRQSGSFQGQQGQQMQQVWQMAQNLPQMCNFRQGPQMCQFRAIFI